jgi:hypothetical protein
LNGVAPAARAERAIVPLGKALAAALETAEHAVPGTARQRALVEVARLGDQLAATIDPAWEGLGGVVLETVAGIRGDRPRRPGT